MTTTSTLVSLLGLIQSYQVESGVVIERYVQEQSIIDGAMRHYWVVTIEGWTPTGQLRRRKVFVTSGQWYQCKEGNQFTP